MSAIRVANVQFDAAATTRIDNPVTNTIVLTTAGSEAMRIDPAGNVGINTTAPTADLHVGGTVNITSTLTLGGGTANAIGTNPNNLVALDTTGKLPAVDGSQLTNITVSSSGSLVAINYYTSSQTITIPAGATQADIILIGAGGGGASGNAATYSGPGGGAGGALKTYLSGLTPGLTLSLTVGTGGSGGLTVGASGSNGTSNTTLSSGTQTISTYNAAFGQGGLSGGPGSGARGGSTSSGANQIGIIGARGADGQASSTFNAGGSVGFAFGISSATATSASTSGYGVGGYGGTVNATGGGAGGGIAVIYWYK